MIKRVNGIGLALAIWTSMVCRLPAADGKLELVVQTGHIRGVSAVAFSPDSKLALTGAEDGTAVLWNATTGQKLRAFEPHPGPVYKLAFNGKQVLTGSEDRVTLWEAATGKKLHALHLKDRAVGAVAFGPDGTRVLTGWGNKVFLW